MNELKLVENGLIKVYTTDAGEYVVDGRELWQGLESKQDFSTWVKKRLEDCDAVENEDYYLLHKKMEQASGAKYLIDYTIKLDTAKEMAMLERNDVGKQYRRYFIEVEKKYKNEQSAISENDYNLRLQEVKTKQAEIMLVIADRVSIENYKQIVYSKAMQAMTGEYCLPLPKIERQTYTATEIGSKLGISSNMVGKLANKYNLKTSEYGVQVWDVAPNGKQVPNWRYYIEVLEPMRQCLELEEKLKEDKKKAKKVC